MTQNFRLAVWAPPYQEKYTDDQAADNIYKMLAEAGINFVYNEQEWDGRLLNRIMNSCQKYGIKSIIGLPMDDMEAAMAVVRKTMNHPACWGYNLRDEPDAKIFGYLAELKAAIKAEAPGHIRFSTNLFPSYAFHWEGVDKINLPQYSEYVRDYIKTVNPDIMSFDFYPFHTETKYDEEVLVYYLKNLLEFNIQCKNSGVQAGSIVQSSSWEGMRVPTDTELEFLVNLNLVSGMKAITYYIYWSHINYNTGETTINGMVTYNGEKNPIYYSVQRINEGLGKMQGVFLPYSQEGYILTNMSEAYMNFDKDIAEKSVLKDSFGPVTGVESGVSVLSGCFTDDAGKKALYVMHYGYEGKGKAPVTLKFAEETSCKIHDFDGISDNNSVSELTLELAPGEGVFVEFK